MKSVILFLFAVVLFMTGCATAPLLTSDTLFSAPIASDKAFDAAVAAGADIGLVTLKGPAPDREKGSVWFVGGTSAAGEVAKRLMPLLALGSTEYVLQVRLRKEGALAAGADLKANRTGLGELTKEQEAAIQEIFSAYKTALRVQLQKKTR